MVTIASILREVVNKVREGSTPHLPPRREGRAWALVEDILRGDAEEPLLAAIQGPPGTGKTELFVGSIAYTLDRIISDEEVKVVYVAPTNELVTQAFIRTLNLLAPRLLKSGYDVSQVVRMFRLYGSSVPRPFLSQTEIDQLTRGMGVNAKDVKDMVQGVINKDVKFVFATEYQRIRSSGNYAYKLLVDEASRTPFYLPFTPVAEQFLRDFDEKKMKGVLESMIIVGDPEQAVAISEEYRLTEKRYLALLLVSEALEKLGLYNERFTMLQESYRIPRPLHQPISEAFYNGKFTGRDEAQSRLKKLEFRLDSCLNALKSCCSDSDARRICGSLEEAVTTGRPLIVANVMKPYWGEGETYEPARIRLAVEFAIAVTSSLKPTDGRGLSVLVTAPYTQLAGSAGLYYAQLTRGKYGWPEFKTVYSVLGGEADVVVAMLGKEYYGGSYSHATVYYREPEIFNVELSRERALMIIIGDVYGLRNKAAELNRDLGYDLSLGRGGREEKILLENSKKLKTCAEETLKLAGVEEFGKKGVKNKQAQGDGGIYIPLE